MANRAFPNSGRVFSNRLLPVSMDFHFQVASTAALGIKNLVNPAGFLANVFMHSSAPVGNPNPEAGIIMLQFVDKFPGFISFNTAATAPLSSSTVTTMTVGNPYVLTSLGTATLAQLQTMGLSTAVATPAVGMSFIAATTALLGSATVAAPATSGIDHIEIVGDPALALQQGAPIILQCLSAGTLTAPADGTLINIALTASNHYNTPGSTAVL